MYVQYGCGFGAPAGWRNFDASPTLRLERLPVVGRFVAKNSARFPENVEYGDIVHGLPMAPGSCRGVFASHVLEHLALDDMRIALANTFLMLQPGGVFRLIVPDLEALARAYLSANDDETALRFVRDSGMGREQRARTPVQHAIALLGNSRHLWMWDFKSMRAELSRAGFHDVRRCVASDAQDPMFSRAEDRGRFDGAVAIECRRPLAAAGASTHDISQAPSANDNAAGAGSGQSLATAIGR